MWVCLPLLSVNLNGPRITQGVNSRKFCGRLNLGSVDLPPCFGVLMYPPRSKSLDRQDSVITIWFMTTSMWFYDQGLDFCKWRSNLVNFVKDFKESKFVKMIASRQRWLWRKQKFNLKTHWSDFLSYELNLIHNQIFVFENHFQLSFVFVSHQKILIKKIQRFN